MSQIEQEFRQYLSKRPEVEKCYIGGLINRRALARHLIRQGIAKASQLDAVIAMLRRYTFRKPGSEGKELFITEFHFYVDEKQMHKFPETAKISVEEALLEEFIEVRHALIHGNEEPIDIFRKTYARGAYIIPKTKVAKYLDSILKFEKKD